MFSQLPFKQQQVRSYRNGNVSLNPATHSKYPFKRPQAVQFLNQFPKYFLRPYRAATLFNTATDEDFYRKLTTKNCEWLVRPTVALTEFSSTLSENIHRLDELQCIGDAKSVISGLKQELTSLNADIQPICNKIFACQKLNDSDVQKMLEVLNKTGDEGGSVLHELMDVGAAMFLMAVHLKAARFFTSDLLRWKRMIWQPDLFNDSFHAHPSVATLREWMEESRLENIPMISPSKIRTMQHIPNCATQNLDIEAEKPTEKQPPSVINTSNNKRIPMLQKSDVVASSSDDSGTDDDNNFDDVTGSDDVFMSDDDTNTSADCNGEQTNQNKSSMNAAISFLDLESEEVLMLSSSEEESNDEMIKRQRSNHSSLRQLFSPSSSSSDNEEIETQLPTKIVADIIMMEEIMNEKRTSTISKRRRKKQKVSDPMKEKIFKSFCKVGRKKQRRFVNCKEKRLRRKKLIVKKELRVIRMQRQILFSDA